jgi:hypothetical protein
MSTRPFSEGLPNRAQLQQFVLLSSPILQPCESTSSR